MINVVIPMAGTGSRFVQAGYTVPKPFIDVAGKPMIARVIENVQLPDARYILISRKEHIRQEAELVNYLSAAYPVTFIEIDAVTEGTVCTVLFARKLIYNNDPLLIANSDQLVDCSMSQFVGDCLSKNLDGSILTFTDPEKNPKWSFARLNDKGLVAEVQEKKPISEFATVGIYFFTQGSDFVNGAIDMMVRNDRVNNEFYTCPVYNYLIRDGKKIGVFTIENSQMHGLGTPEDLNKYVTKIYSTAHELK